MINAYEVQKILPHLGHPDAKRVIIELVSCSDATILAQFGTAFLWLVYIFFSNLSKYFHCWHSSHAAHHIAYFPSVSFMYTVTCHSHLIDVTQAPRFILWLVPGNIWDSPFWGDNHTLQVWTYPSILALNSQCSRFYWGMQTWHFHLICWQYHSSCVPSILHLHCWPPREVRQFWY